MQQLSLLDYQPEPEQLEKSQSSIRFHQGDRVIANSKEGRGNVATPHDRHTVQPYEPPPKAVNAHAIAWQEGNIAYYRQLMLRFMELQRLDVTAGTDTLQKQATRRHMINHLHGLCEACLTKIKQLGGE